MCSSGPPPDGVVSFCLSTHPAVGLSSRDGSLCAVTATWESNNFHSLQSGKLETRTPLENTEESFNSWLCFLGRLRVTNISRPWLTFLKRKDEEHTCFLSFSSFRRRSSSSSCLAISWDRFSFVDAISCQWVTKLRKLNWQCWIEIIENSSAHQKSKPVSMKANDVFTLSWNLTISCCARSLRSSFSASAIKISSNCLWRSSSSLCFLNSSTFLLITSCNGKSQ